MQTVEDASFAEGDETLVLDVRPPAGSSVQVDGSFELVIAEAGVRPCPGILVSGRPAELNDRWDSLPSLETETATIRLILETDSTAAGVAFDWVGPYKDYHRAAAWNPSFRVRNVDPVTQLDQKRSAVFVHWSFEDDGWTACGAAAPVPSSSNGWRISRRGFRFRSEDGGSSRNRRSGLHGIRLPANCVGEPEAVCTGAGWRWTNCARR